MDGGDIRHVEHRGHLLKYNDDPRGDDEADDVQPHPPHTTINLSDEEKGGLLDKRDRNRRLKKKGGKKR